MSWDSAPVVAKGPAAAQPVKAGWDAAPVAARAPNGPKRKSLMLGAMEGVLPVAEKVAPYSPLNYLIPGFREANQQSIARAHQRIDERRQTEKPSILGKTVAGLEATAPLALITKDPALLGFGQGALQSESKDALGVGLDGVMGAGLNWAGGKAVGAITDALAPVVSPAVRKLVDAGVKLTPGQIKGGNALASESKAMSRPIVGDAIAGDRAAFTDTFNRGAVNRALFPLGVRLPDNIGTGHDAVAFMQQATGKAYDDILPKLSLKPDARLAVGMRKAQMIAQGLPPEQQSTFLNLVRSNLDFGSQGGLMSGRQLTRAVRDLRTKAGGYGRSSMEGERQLGQALDEIVSGVDSSLSAQNPQFAPLLKNANKAYRDSLVVNRAAAGADDGIATTAQFKTASKAVDRTKNKRATAAGNGPMQDYTKAGRSVTGKTPDSGTATRLMDGKWIPMARGAVDRAGYEADKALTQLRLLPRSPEIQKLAGLIEQYRPQISAVAGPGLTGLLAGLVPHD